MRTPLATALACAALALAACGGDEETTSSTTSAPEAGASGASGASGTEDAEPVEGGGKPAEAGESDSVRVAEAVAAAVGGSDPEAACTTAVTAGYVKSAYGDEKGCRAAVEAQNAFSVSVGEVRVDSDAGTAETTAVPGGGPNEGEDLTVRLVEEGEDWKVDFVRSDAPAGP